MNDNSSTPARLTAPVPYAITILLLCGLVLASPLALWASEGASEGRATRAFSQTGYASWYGGKFQGRPTASGEIFDTNELTAAHKRLPFGTRVEVTNLSNGKSVVVRINDRGPFVKGRIIDLSRAAAEQIEMLGSGVAKVSISVISRNGQPEGNGSAEDPPEKSAQEAKGETDVDTPGSGASNSTTADGEIALPLPKLPDESGDPSAVSDDDSIYTFPDPVSYTIQIASFTQKENARRLFTALEKAGLSPSYERSSKGHIRVVIARIEPERLESTKRRLAELGHDSYLLRENL